jgi:hypothetical protein
VEAIRIIQSYATTPVWIQPCRLIYLAVASYSCPRRSKTHHESIRIGATWVAFCYAVGILTTTLSRHRVAEWILTDSVAFVEWEIERMNEERESKDREESGAGGEHVQRRMKIG